MLATNSLYEGDCLDFMKLIDDESIDMILCDLPYGTTQCKWDTIIPFEPLWEQYKRIIKPKGAIVLTASQPFTSKLVISNLHMFRYEWIWDKVLVSGHLSSKFVPMKRHENILIFCNGTPNYYPIMKTGKLRTIANGTASECTASECYGKQKNIRRVSDQRYPNTIVEISNANRVGRLHPTQKPVALFEYLIRTYTREGDLVLDNCAGSGTTAIAAMNTNRNYILIEQDPKYCNIIRKRIATAQIVMP